MVDRHIRFLLLEDNAGDVLLMNEFMEESCRGCTLHRAGRLAEAVELLQSEDFDLVLMDLNLPDSSGRDILLKVRKEAPRLPVVVLSGFCSEGHEDLLELGARGFLRKGEFTEQEFWDVVADALKKE